MTIVMQRIEQPIQMDSLKTLKEVDVEAGRSSTETPKTASTISSFDGGMSSSFASSITGGVVDRPHDEEDVVVIQREPQQSTIIEEEETEVAAAATDEAKDWDWDWDDFCLELDRIGQPQQELESKKRKHDDDSVQSESFATMTQSLCFHSK